MTKRLTLDRISKAIQDGANYIIDNAINEDGGLKWSEATVGTQESGVWTTAEALHFFLSSTLYSIEIDKIKGMLTFILDAYVDTSSAENPTMGYWPMLKNGTSSNITTGYCVFVLKLAFSLFPEKREEILGKINGGESWLRKHFIDCGNYGFWAENHNHNDNRVNSLPDKRDHIFCTINSYMGLIYPYNPNIVAHLEKDPNVRTKIINYLNEQADFFAKRSYSDVEFKSCASTICRLSYICNYLGVVNEDTKIIDNKIKDIAEKYVNQVHVLTINTDPMGGAQTILHDFVLYDVGRSLIALANGNIIERVIKEILGKLESEKCYSFQPSERHDVWPTIECLFILEGYSKYIKEKKTLDYKKIIKSIREYIKSKKVYIIIILSIVAIVLWIFVPAWREKIESGIISLISSVVIK